MLNILAILTELANEPSINNKVKILEREKDNELLKRAFIAAYNPMITYGIKQIPTYKHVAHADSLSDALSNLQYLADRTYTGNIAVDHLRSQLENTHPDDATVIERIIQRDLRCGTSDSLASRVWEDLVPTFDVMLSHSDISGIKYPAYAQIKSDGARCHMSLRGGKAVAFSRNGKPIELHGMFDAALASIIEEGETLDGELLAFKQGKTLDRKTGNGIVNKAVKGTISKEDAECLVLATWDIVDFTSTIPYKDRIHRLNKALIENPNTKISVLATTVVNDEQEAYKFYKQCRDNGEEGAMIKNMDAVWQPKRSKDIGKMKAIETADLRIKGWYYGDENKQFKDGLGGFLCESEDGIVKVRVGGGYSKEFRLQDTSVFDSMVGGVMEVLYNEKIQDKKTKVWSLFLPRVDSDTNWYRIDKNVANTFEELK